MDFELDLDFKVKLFKEWLENGGLETIFFDELLKDLIKVKFDIKTGKVIPETVSSIVKSAMNAQLASQLMGPYFSDKIKSEYQTFLQKDIFFNQENIDSLDRLIELMDSMSATEKTIFRGQNEAKYRLYSSLQRFWLDNKLYDAYDSYLELLEKTVSEGQSQNKNLILRYFESSRINPKNELAVLSFLQHFGCPTPLLDWTYSFENALYFAISGATVNESTVEIQDYVSVYWVEEEFVESSGLREIIDEGLKVSHSKIQSGVISAMEESGLSEEDTLKFFSDKRLELAAKMMYGSGVIAHLTEMKNLVEIPLTYFSDHNKDLDLPFYLNNNLNIVNQQGAFTWNSSPYAPVEQVGQELFEKEHGESQGYKFCHCINIHKKLLPEIKAILDAKGINEDYIYPDPNKIAGSVKDKILQK